MGGSLTGCVRSEIGAEMQDNTMTDDHYRDLVDKLV